MCCSRNWAKFFLHRRGSFSKEHRIYSIFSQSFGAQEECAVIHIRTLLVAQLDVSSLYSSNELGGCDWRTEGVWRRTRIRMGRDCVCCAHPPPVGLNSTSSVNFMELLRRTTQTPLSFLPSKHHCLKLSLGENTDKSANFQTGKWGKRCHSLWGSYFYFCRLL